MSNVTFNLYCYIHDWSSKLHQWTILWFFQNSLLLCLYRCSKQHWWCCWNTEPLSSCHVQLSNSFSLEVRYQNHQCILGAIVFLIRWYQFHILFNLQSNMYILCYQLFQLCLINQNHIDHTCNVLHSWVCSMCRVLVTNLGMNVNVFYNLILVLIRANYFQYDNVHKWHCIYVDLLKVFSFLQPSQCLPHYVCLILHLLTSIFQGCRSSI